MLPFSCMVEFLNSSDFYAPLNMIQLHYYITAQTHLQGQIFPCTHT